MAKRKKPHLLADNPALKIANRAVIFRDKNGRFSSPAKGVSFEITIKNRKKPLKGKIPEQNKSIRSKELFIIKELLTYTKNKHKKLSAVDKEIHQEIARKRKKPLSAREKKEKARLRIETREALKREGIKKIPRLTPQLDRRVTVSPPSFEKFVTRSGTHHKKRNRMSRESEGSFDGSSLNIVKKKVEFDPANPVKIMPFNAKATAISMREFFKPHVVNFLDEMRKNSTNKYIFRIETKNRLGEHETREGIGSERFHITEKLSSYEIREYRKLYPGLTKDQLLRQVQIDNMYNRLEDVFSMFEDRYTAYLSREIISSMAVTGFSMEVVKGVMT